MTAELEQLRWKMSLEHLVIPDSKEVIKNNLCRLVTRIWLSYEQALTGKIWVTLSLKIITNKNKL